MSFQSHFPEGPPGCPKPDPPTDPPLSNSDRVCLWDGRSTSTRLTMCTAPRKQPPLCTVSLAASNKTLSEEKYQHATRQACLSSAVKHHYKVTLIPQHACTPLIRESTELEREKRREDSQVEYKENVPVTPHCSPDRSVSETPPADVALVETQYNPLTRRCGIAADLTRDASAVGGSTTL